MQKKWLELLKVYWLNKEVDKIVKELFNDNVEYYETPFEQIGDITNVWNDILEQDIKKLEYKIIGILENTVIANYFMVLENGYMCDMVYEIKLNDKGKCYYFKQWYMNN